MEKVKGKNNVAMKVLGINSHVQEFHPLINVELYRTLL